MNLYPQNNNVYLPKTIQVCFVNVTYFNIIEDSAIHQLITRLILAQKEFQKSIDWNFEVSEIKSKALELSTILESLMESSSKLDYNKRKELSEKVIQSSCIVIKQYNKALSIDGFEEKIVKELKDYTQKFFNNFFGNILDYNFWFKLQCYEWLLKEGFISDLQSNYPNNKYSFIFDNETLEDFFVKNRSSVINLMLDNKNDCYGLTFSSPLSNTDASQAYRLFCEINASMQSID